MSAAPLVLLGTLGSTVVAVAAAGTSADPARATARAASALAIGAAGALALLALAVDGGPTAIGPLEVDAFAGLVLVLVLGVGATVVSFAGRSLRHEPYQRRFATVGAALVGAAATFATADDLVLLGAAWVATSALTVALVRTGPAAGRALRSQRLARTFAAGDVLVLAGIGLLAASSGATALDRLEADGTLGAAAGVLLVLGAAARSATAPFHRWLPDTLGAPTPSSALLHAGVVNGGAILLLTLSPAVAPHLAPAVLAVTMGALSCAFAEAVMLTRPDVKGRLAWSTVAQMSFTLVLCGLGLHTAAALHLVAHGMYKGALFLGSGSTVRALVRDRMVPSDGAASRAVDALVAPVAIVGAAALAVAATGVEPSADLLVPVGLACITGTAAVRGWRGRAATAPQRLTGLAAASALVATFVLITVELKAQVAPAVGGGDPVLPGVLVLAVLAPLVAIAWAERRPEHPALAPLWAGARRAGRPAPPAPARSMLPTRTSPSTLDLESGLIGG